jgi:hypothetical protein
MLCMVSCQRVVEDCIACNRFIVIFKNACVIVSCGIPLVVYVNGTFTILHA